MQTNKVRRKPLPVIIAALLLVLVAFVLLETAFFHINPLKVGFNRIDHERYVIFAKRLPAGRDAEKRGFAWTTLQIKGSDNPLQ
jgi:hypothetical protein